MKVQKPLISVVIPTYNHALFLKKALESVQKQSWSNWEVIVVNNYSEDDTVFVVNSLNDHRIRLVNFRNHGVIGASRNEGIKHALGEYVAFLDSDDCWYPEKLSLCVKALQSGYDWVCHGEIWTYEDGFRKQVTYGPACKASYYPLLYQNNCISTSATVVRKEVLDKVGGFSTDPMFIAAEDYELWLKIAKAGNQICFLDDMLGEYSLHSTNASKNIWKHTKAVMAVITYHYNLEKNRNLTKKIRYGKRIVRLKISSAWLWLRSRKYHA